MNTRTRIGVIGLDGLSIELFKNALDKGYMSYLSNIRHNLILRRLDPLIPLTFPSWASIMTGVNPCKHGILDFFKYQLSDNCLRSELYSALDLRHPRIHEMLHLSRKNIKTFITDPIPSYPIIPVKNSTIVSFAYFVPKPISYPKDAFTKYFGIGAWRAIEKLLNSWSCKNVIDASMKLLDSYIEAAEKIIGHNYDLIWFTINLPDALLHKCPKSFQDVKRLSGVFRKIDRLVRKIGENVDDLIIVSDHGFTSYKYAVNIDKLLYEQGFMKIRSISNSKQTLHHTSISNLLLSFLRSRHSITLLPKISLMIRKMLDYALGIRLPKIIPSNEVANVSIDYEKSKAFVPRPLKATFYIVLKDETVKNSVANILKKYGLSASDLNAIYKCDESLFDIRRLAIIWNDVIKCFPMQLSTIYVALNKPLLSKGFFVHHSRYGVFIIRSEYKELINLRDPVPNTIVAPIVIARLGVPINSVSDDARYLRKLFSDSETYDYLPEWRITIAKFKLRSKFSST